MNEKPEPDPRVILKMLQGLRMEEHDPEEFLAVLAEIREMLPPEFRRDPKSLSERTSRVDAWTEEDFAWGAVADAVRSVLAEIEAVADAKRRTLFEKVLDIYYAAEKASHEPENAHLLPHVQKMREAYERGYGHPIPTQEETEARRRREGWKGKG